MNEIVSIKNICENGLEKYHGKVLERMRKEYLIIVGFALKQMKKYINIINSYIM